MFKVYILLFLINAFSLSVSGQIKLNILYSKSGLLYRGVNNKISFDSIACKGVIFSSDDAKLYINSGWMECYPNSLQPVIIVATTNRKGAAPKIERFTFEVKKLPSSIGLRCGNIQLIDTINKSYLLVVGKLGLFYSHDLYLPSFVRNFTLEAGDFAFNITGDMLSNDAKTAIRKLKLGSKTSLTNIRVAAGPSFCDYKLADIQLILN